MQKLVLLDNLFPALRNGEIRLTVRKGYRDIRLGNMEFHNVSDDDIHEVYVEEVRHLQLMNIEYDIVKMDNYRSLDELVEGLRVHYPDISLDDEITVVIFSNYGDNGMDN